MKTINYSQKTDKLANTSSLASMTRTTKIITAAAGRRGEQNRRKKLMKRTRFRSTVTKRQSLAI